jgi:hypothetical protein
MVICLPTGLYAQTLLYKEIALHSTVSKTLTKAFDLAKEKPMGSPPVFLVESYKSYSVTDLLGLHFVVLPASQT